MSANGENCISMAAMHHAVFPRHYGAVAEPDAHARITGPCGDTMDFWLAVRDGVIQRIGFTTDGCGSSRACGSMTCELAAGRPTSVAAAIEPEQVLEALAPFPAEVAHCAVLAVNTLRAVCRKLPDPPPVPPDAERAQPSRNTPQKEPPMRIAIPLAEGRLATHFGHCASFALIDVDPDSGRILGREDAPAPPHQPGLLPAWLADRGVHLIIAGGMGARAQGLFAQRGIDVLVGAPAESPEHLVEAWLSGTLATGQNLCDH